MPTHIARYDVLISHPSDAEDEANIVRESISRLNHAHSKEEGIELIPLDWNYDTRADSGDEPQKLINKQLVDECDIVIAIFKQRYGSPTSDYGSGTEEEIMLALKTGKRVMLYCWEPMGGFIDEIEIEKINDLKRRLGKSVLYKSFSNCDDLREKMNYELAKLIGALREESSRIGIPALSLMGISGTGVTDNLVIRRPNIEALANLKKYKSVMGSLLSDITEHPLTAHDGVSEELCEEYSTEASSQMNEIAEKCRISMHIPKGTADFFSAKPYAFPQENIGLISGTLGSLGFDVPDDLFDLGNLGQRTTLDALNYGTKLVVVGTEDEEEKHKKLIALRDVCVEYNESKAMIDRFFGMGLIGLAIRNNGGRPAHHVRIELRFPRGVLLNGESIPSPGDYLLAIFEERFAKALLTINATEHYESYDETVVRIESGFRVGYLPQPKPWTGLGIHEPPAFDEGDYRNQVASLLGDYSIVLSHDGSEEVLRLSMDCVRHGAAYAFPAFIPISLNGAANVEYCILADENPDSICGTIELVIED